jgi:hypothetical protein
MVGIIERIGSLAGTELAKAVNLAHSHYTERMNVHGHTGRALIETVAEVCRNHPNLVGIGVGLLVEQLLTEEKKHHDAQVRAQVEAHPQAVDPVTGEPIPAPPAEHGAIPGPASTPADPSHPDHPDHHLHLPSVHVPGLHVSTLKPGKTAWEVFGALMALKVASFTARLFRRNHTEVWFAPAARIHLISGSIATYYFVKSMRSPKISAWRNAAIALFATDALKPVLKHRPAKR